MFKSQSLQLSKPAYTDLGPKQDIAPLFYEGESQTAEVWTKRRDELLIEWRRIIGKPSFDSYEKGLETVETFKHPEFNGTLYRQSTGPSSAQLVLVMEPLGTFKGPRPGAVVPFYHPDASAGFDIENKKTITDSQTIQFGLHLVRQGYVAVCTEAFPFNTVPEPDVNEGFSWWQAAADKLLEDNPGWTGIGKLIGDTSRGVDLLLGLDNIDRERIVIIGHSLGGKMAFCTGAFDNRIKAVIASDFGIGWDFTNWDNDWYFGRQIHGKEFRLANHQLLAMLAPRPFLLIGGQYDGPASWQYINEAKKVYRLYGKDMSVGFLDHASGHRPPEYAVDIAYRWLSEQFEYPYGGTIPLP